MVWTGRYPYLTVSMAKSVNEKRVTRPSQCIFFCFSMKCVIFPRFLKTDVTGMVVNCSAPKAAFFYSIFPLQKCYFSCEEPIKKNLQKIAAMCALGKLACLCDTMLQSSFLEQKNTQDYEKNVFFIS